MSKHTNPTRTLKIENAWLRDVARRWNEFSRTAVTELRKVNKAAASIANAEEPFQMSPTQIRTYMVFLQAQIDQILMGARVSAIGGNINWQAQYQLTSYERSLAVSRASLKSQGASLIATTAEELAAIDIRPFNIQPSLATASTGAFPPVHADALEFLFTRSFEKLEGWTDSMATETRQILMDGADQGQGIAEVVKNMRARIDVSESRAQLIARTETIQAFQVAQTKEAERAADELGEVILLRWITARDNIVRHQHAVWHGTLATPKENAAKITLSPWNCRCAQIPVIAEANTPAKQKKFDEQRKALLSMGTATRRRA